MLWHSNPRRNESATIPQSMIQLTNRNQHLVSTGLLLMKRWCNKDTSQGQKGDGVFSTKGEENHNPGTQDPHGPLGVFKFQPPPSFVCLQMLADRPENSSIRSCKKVTRRGSKHLVMSKISRLQYVSPNICYVSVCPRCLVLWTKESICISLYHHNLLLFFFRFFWYLHLGSESGPLREVLISILPHQSPHLLRCRCHGCAGWGPTACSKWSFCTLYKHWQGASSQTQHQPSITPAKSHK